MQPLAQSLGIAAPEIVLALGAMLLLMVGTFRGDRSLGLISWLAVVIYAVAGVFMMDDSPRAFAFDGLYVADLFSDYLKVVVYGAAAVCTVIAIPYLRRAHSDKFEYPVLLMLGALGMGMMVSANDLLSLYVGLELQSLAAYVLAAFHRSEAKSSEAGLKYFVLGALASGILLYGISLIYGFVGSTNFVALGTQLEGEASIGIVFGLVFIFSGLAFKISAVPFHMWTPDVYEGAPTPVAAFFASAPKVAAMGLLVRVAIEGFGGLADEWRQIIAFAAVASMILGAVGAIGQTSIKRLLAYSSINNVGFALIGLAAGTEAGIAGVLFYMGIYAAMTIGSFLVVLALRDPDGTPVDDMARLAGLSKTRPGLAAALAVFMFSLAGIPPMLGFWPKFSVFNAAIASEMYVLAVIGVVTSVVGAYYYLRVVKLAYFDEPVGTLAPGDSRVNGVVLTAAAVFCSPLGMLAIAPLVAWATAAARIIVTG
ncbi:NADH-quinone oxidoreductase subunit NuoN [Sphingosinicella sp.]|jgi:NADH-quinone oxidoreductase subunit N|uniref:NADH-quinone oxidoreductase subunit NuoN n=1 Tax=Sphingosinicella sp. TaxID=1917971 RepID=UPI0017A734C8|nr:NADH-quinone oxidoreductase subunit NuoN [Sphingosinicella sp.]MBA4757213.1 NADH-quinone oxidoreductase subunit NuoN [Sphingosinicella sp.]